MHTLAKILEGEGGGGGGLEGRHGLLVYTEAWHQISF